VRSQYSKEIAHRTELESLLRQVVSGVKEEIVQSKSKSTLANKRTTGNNIELTVQDRERIIETLLSQEAVLALLYENAFPGRGPDEETLSDSSSDLF
jgi:hypothetical protein